MTFINVAIYVCLIFSLFEHVKIPELPFYILLKFGKFFENILPCFPEKLLIYVVFIFLQWTEILRNAMKVPKVELLEINLFYWPYLQSSHPQF